MTFPTTDGGLTATRGSMEPTAARPQSDLQRRIEQAQAEGMERRTKSRNGGPEDMSEVDRELTMASGAIQGVQQRLAELAVKLGPVMPGDTLSRLQRGDDTLARQEFEIATEVGQRVRSLTMEISEIEHALSYLLAVRL